MRAQLITLLAATFVATSGMAALAFDASNDGALGAAVGIDGSTATSNTSNTDVKNTTFSPSETTNVSKENGNTIASDNTITKTSTDNTNVTKESNNTIASNNSATKTETTSISKDSDNTITVTKTDNSKNIKDSGNSIASGNTSTKTDVDIDKSVENKGSFNTSTKTETENEDSFNTTDISKSESYSKSESSTDSHAVSVTVGDVAVAVSSSALSGTVSANSIDLAPRTDMTTGNNDISGSAFQNAAGITAASQNTGVNSLVQQSVNVQSNMSLNPTR